jgi:ABC-2 type transport system ATP-binding protein
MNPVIRFQNTSKRYGKTVALDDVSFDIPAGVVCAVLGANGAGKSTAIRLLLGLDDLDSGSTEVLGMNSRTHALEIRSRVGYVADQPPLYDWMTVGEIGWFATGFYPTGYQAQYDSLLRKFDLDEAQKISGLSKGMRAKVALSLAMAHRPELLILDEPTSGLDPLVRREFLESMIDVSAEGRTVLLASHQVSEVERVADMVAILLNGKLICRNDWKTSNAALRKSSSHCPTLILLCQQYRATSWPTSLTDTNTSGWSEAWTTTY